MAWFRGLTPARFTNFTRNRDGNMDPTSFPAPSVPVSSWKTAPPISTATHPFPQEWRARSRNRERQGKKKLCYIGLSMLLKYWHAAIGSAGGSLKCHLVPVLFFLPVGSTGRKSLRRSFQSPPATRVHSALRPRSLLGVLPRPETSYFDPRRPACGMRAWETLLILQIPVP